MATTIITVTVSAAGVVLDSAAAVGTELDFLVGFGHAIQLLFLPLLAIACMFIGWTMIIKTMRHDDDNV